MATTGPDRARAAFGLTCRSWFAPLRRRSLFFLLYVAAVVVSSAQTFIRPHIMKAQPSPAKTLKSTVSQAVSAGQRVHMAEKYGRLPLGFESNQGQTDGRVKFLSRGQGYALFLTGDEAVLSLRKAPSETPAVRSERGGRAQHSLFGAPALQNQNPLALSMPKEKLANANKMPGPAAPFSSPRRAESGDSSTVLRMRLVGANATAAVTGADELPGKSNYFIGNDPRKWRTNVANYAKVKCQDVYPGVDMVYYGNQDGQLEYDFVVAPGTDPNAIKLEVGTGLGVPLQIAADGALVVKTGGGEVRFHKPVVYQTESTDNRQSLEGHYTLDSQNHVRFQIEPYDHSKALFIDPVLSYSTYLGGTGPDQGNGIAVDSSGSAYVTGSTYSPNFPIVNGFQGSLQGQVSAFVSKLSADGSSLVYSTYLGGSASGSSAASTSAAGIAVDSSGSAYVTGYTTATNFPTQNPFQSSLQGAESAFVTKLSADGSALVYSTYLGGPDTVGGTGLPPSPASNSAAGIAVDSSGSAYVAGFTNATDFPTQNPFQSGCVLALYGNCDSPAFVTKLSADGSSLVYSTYLQGTVPGSPGNSGSYLTDVSPYAIAVDSSGSAYITGITNSPVFPVTQNAFLQSCVLAYYEASPYTLCYGYAFVTKLSGDGSSLVYSTYLGGAIASVYGQESVGTGIALDSGGQAYISGWTNCTNFPTMNAFQGSLQGGNSAFVTELTADGSALLYSTYLGGTLTGYGGASTTAAGIAVDSSGDIYVTGSTNTTDFPTANPLQATCGSCDEASTAFVTKFNAGGSGLAYSTYLGGSGDDNASAIAVDSTGNAYVTGNTQSSNFPTVNPIQATYAGGYGDAFVAKISTAAPIVSLSPATLAFGPQQLGTTSGSQTETVTNTGAGNLTISTVTTGGTNAADFSKTADTCTGASVTPNSTCMVSVTFTPTVAGSESGAITITDNASGSPQTVSLTGTGMGPVASLTTTGLTFSSQTVGTQSASQTFALNNTGNSALTITNIAFTGANPGDFGESNPCGVSVPAGGSCTFSVWFIPTAPGSRAAALTITDNSYGVAGSQQSVSLAGFGSGPMLSYAPASLAFGNQNLGTTSAAHSVTLTNLGNAVLTITNIGTSGSNPGDFGLTTTCNGTVAVNGSCTISVTFTPTATGSRTASLNIVDNAYGSPQTVSLSGTGISAQTFTTLFSFDYTDGGYPASAGLVQAANGDGYGTTSFGGASGGGTVFKMTPTGMLTTIYNFCSQSACADGTAPTGGLVQATNLDFYGTTSIGGAGDDGGIGGGTVFKITPSGTLTTLYSFCSQSNCTDGAEPMAGLVQGTNGDFYGTTSNGGAYDNGTVFKIAPSGTLTTLYSFCAQSECTDGAEPLAGLVQATNGDFYGTTKNYGANGGGGTVFKITPSGTLTTLHSFCAESGCADGANPYAALVEAANGDFYGTTYGGGAPSEGGTVFRITPSGTLTTLHRFCAQSACRDGKSPYAGLVQATNGDLYGTTEHGGASGDGTVFKITPNGALTTLRSFCAQSGCTDGTNADAGLLQGTNGDFYGTTEYGGANGYGTVFSLSVGLGPFVKTLPTSGKVGAAVKILGSNLTGATAVTFSGVAAVFKVVSKSEITTTVPAGAPTGTVQVVTPSGTLLSNVPFRVLP